MTAITNPVAVTPAADAEAAMRRQLELLMDQLLRHDGFGALTVEMRLLKRRQKEVILHFGRQYRFVVDFVPDSPDDVRS